MSTDSITLWSSGATENHAQPSSLRMQLSATSGAPSRRKRAAAPAPQAALLPEVERLPNGEPAEITWHDFTTDERTPYAQAALF